MKRVKRKYKAKYMSNGNVSKFYTSDITSDQIQYYSSLGFDFIFEYVCKSCKDSKCECK